MKSTIATLLFMSFISMGALADDSVRGFTFTPEGQSQPAELFKFSPNGKLVGRNAMANGDCPGHYSLKRGQIVISYDGLDGTPNSGGGCANANSEIFFKTNPFMLSVGQSIQVVSKSVEYYMQPKAGILIRIE